MRIRAKLLLQSRMLVLVMTVLKLDRGVRGDAIKDQISDAKSDNFLLNGRTPMKSPSTLFALRSPT